MKENTTFLMNPVSTFFDNDFGWVTLKLPSGFYTQRKGKINGWNIHQIYWQGNIESDSDFRFPSGWYDLDYKGRKYFEGIYRMEVTI